MAVVQRGMVMRGDLALYDGRTVNASRPDATGGRVTGLAIDDSVDVLQVFGSGTQRSRGTIANALARAGGSDVSFRFAIGDWAIDDDLTIPVNITAYIPAGCTFNVATGKTLTFLGTVYQDVADFSSGLGDIVVHATSDTLYRITDAEVAAGITPTNYWYPPYYVDRYGTNSVPGTTDMTAAFQSAINAAREDGGGNTVYWGATGTYLTSSTLILAAYGTDGVSLICPTHVWYSAPQVCLITSTINGPTFNCSGQDATHFAIAPLISGGSIQNLSTGASACVVQADYSGGLRIRNCWLRHNKRGVYAPTSLCVSPRFEEVIVDSPTTVGANYSGDFWNPIWYGGRSFSADYGV
jgi:hypothetical protein